MLRERDMEEGKRSRSAKEQVKDRWGIKLNGSNSLTLILTKSMSQREIVIQTHTIKLAASMIRCHYDENGFNTNLKFSHYRKADQRG